MNREQRRKAARGSKRKASEEERLLSLGGVRSKDVEALHREAMARHGVGIGVIVREEQRHQVLEDSLAAQRRRTSQWRQPLTWWRLRRAEGRERVERQLWNDRLAECAEAVAREAMGR